MNAEMVSFRAIRLHLLTKQHIEKKKNRKNYHKQKTKEEVKERKPLILKIV